MRKSDRSDLRISATQLFYYTIFRGKNQRTFFIKAPEFLRTRCGNFTTRRRNVSGKSHKTGVIKTD